MTQSKRRAVCTGQFHVWFLMLVCVSVASAAETSPPNGNAPGVEVVRVAGMARKGDAASVKWLQAEAAASDLIAMTNLGYLYEKGFGLAKDETQAATWYRKAADKGDPTGM